MIVVVKVGTSSLTDSDGVIDAAAISALATEVVEARRSGHRVVLVSSGAIAAGMPALGIAANDRPADPRTLQAIAAVGQTTLMTTWSDAFARLDGSVSGQVLLAPLDFMVRQQYLHARSTVARLLELGVVPIVNENDAIADDEIRFGDNDRLAALVAQLLSADALVLLTDAPGVLTADPRLDEKATLIDEIVEVDSQLMAVAGGAGSARGSGGMATKLAAARIAAWSGVRTVIADASRSGVLLDAIADRAGVGTSIRAHSTRLSARKVWIAFAVGSSGRLAVDQGAREALENGSSLLAPGVVRAEGGFGLDDAVELVDVEGRVFAKGLVRFSADRIGDGTAEGVVVHRDDLVMLPRE